MALCGDLTLEEGVDLLYSRQQNEWMNGYNQNISVPFIHM